MIIPTIKLTEEEAKQAIQEWLAKRGIGCKVRTVDRNYSSAGKFAIELEEPQVVEEPAPMVNLNNNFDHPGRKVKHTTRAPQP